MQFIPSKAAVMAAGLLGIVSLLPQASQPAQAAAPLAHTQGPGFYRLMVGEVEVTALLDENSPWPESVETLFPSLNAAQRERLRQTTRLQPQNDFSTIAFLVNTGKKLILVDAGGLGSGPGYGQLFANLVASGYRPEQVDDIFLTHMHPDHVYGLSSAGRMNFPNAVVHADVHELPQWQGQAAKGNAVAREIIARVQPYIAAGRYQTFEGDSVFAPEFKTHAAYGHSDGHSFYSVESQGYKLLFWGDFVVNDKVQFEMPAVTPPGEADPAKGIALRQAKFAEAAQQGYLIAGAHFSFPGVGRVRALERRYLWVPVDYAALAPLK